MNRRNFVKSVLLLPLGLFFSKFAKAGSGDLKSFGYYQGLTARQKRDPRRTDGTYSNMPLIRRVDIDAAVEKTYNFWHGHGAQHRFTLTEADFIALQNGETVESYTTLVDGHRHVARIIGN